MLHIIICEDDLRQREQIESIVKTYITTQKYDIKLALSTPTPIEVLDYINAHPSEQRLYFLDVDLHHEINGIALGSKIREVDQFAKIVFITTHDEMAHLTFKHKIQAMDYIIKGDQDNISSRTAACLKTAYDRYQKELSEQIKYFTVNVHGEVFHISHDEILFFETHPTINRRMILHTESGKLDFRGMVGKIAEHSPEFYLCHKSFVVNISKIKSINKLAKEIRMVNDEIVPVATRKMPELLQLVK